MFEVGRLCVKLAGRDAGQKCVVVETMDNNMVLIDGQTRRRKCNTLHLEPLDQVLHIKKGASEADVIAAFKKIDIEIVESKSRKAAERPVAVRKGADQSKNNAPKASEKKKAAPKKAHAEKKAEAKEEKSEEAKPKKAPAKKAAKKKEE